MFAGQEQQAPINMQWRICFMRKSIIIWGAGIWGDIAFHYYNKKGSILCYIDNDQRKWGQILNGIEICPPEILKSRKAHVVLAVKYGVQNIIKQLKECDIESYTRFQAMEEVYSEQDGGIEREVYEDTCIVAFSGGLGNQMFQYAFLRNLELSGKKVMADLKAYSNGTLNFLLTDIFRNIKLELCTEKQKQELVEKNAKEIGRAVKFLIYSESYEYGITKNADLSLLDISGGIFYGMHQNCVFPERVRKELLEDFFFTNVREDKLKRLRDSIAEKNTVSVHIRRGDYLTENNKWFYGGICTEEYYKSAFVYIEQKIGKCTLCFFSNDIKWVKEKYDIEDAIYIEEGMFDDYQDWYDMYLMSVCRHNIIANSSFSWWGAWLNQNEDKIVIAPKKWINIYEYEDIYPKQWVQI